MSLSDRIITVSDSEKEILKNENQKFQVEVFPHVFRIDSVGKRTEYNKRKDLLFIGSFEHLPNPDGIIWFVKNIFPKIIRVCPNITLKIIGSNPTKEVTDLNSKNVKVIGYEKNIDRYFRDARVFVAPLRFGAGVKGKILQSMSFGLPVVTTNIGAEAICSENLLIADNENQFAEKVLKLYNDSKMWELYSRRSIEYVSNNFTPKVCEKHFKALFASF